MTINQRIRGALAGLGLPAVPNVDTKKRDRCFTFNYDLLPIGFADNCPSSYKALIQVHLFLPLKEDPLVLKERTILALAAVGFTWPEVVDASDDEAQHFVFECEALEEVKHDG